MTAKLTTGQLQQVASAIVDSLSDLLSMSAQVVDDNGLIMAERVRSTTKVDNGDGTVVGEHEEYLRTWVDLGGHAAQVVLLKPRNLNPPPVNAVRTIVDLMVRQKLFRAQVDDRYEARSAFINDLLYESGGATGAAMLREAGSLGIDLRREMSVLVVNAADYVLHVEPHGAAFSEARASRRARYVEDRVGRFFSGHSEVICSYTGNGEIAVFKGSGYRDLLPWMDRNEPHDKHDANSCLGALLRAGEALQASLAKELGKAVDVGVGRRHPGAQGIAYSYGDAQIAMWVGAALKGRNRAHSLHTLGFDAFARLDGERIKFSLARQILLPISKDPELYKTLEVFLQENWSYATSAEKLSVHRNTLNYRLEKVARLTGFDPRKLDDAVQLRLATALASFVHGDELPGPFTLGRVEVSPVNPEYEK